MKRLQDVAATKRAHAEANLELKMRALKRLVTSIGLWQRRAAYYAKRAAMSDAEVAANKVKRDAAARQRREARARRGIKL